MKIFFFSFRLKQFGLLSLFFCKNIGVKKKKTQWRAIKQLKSLINCIKMLTLDYLGFHLCIIGTINGRKRATRYHIVKTYKASIQDLRLDIHYVYNQSVSVHGALGIHFWVFF